MMESSSFDLRSDHITGAIDSILVSRLVTRMLGNGSTDSGFFLDIMASVVQAQHRLISFIFHSHGAVHLKVLDMLVYTSETTVLVGNRSATSVPDDRLCCIVTRDGRKESGLAPLVSNKSGTETFFSPIDSLFVLRYSFCSF